MPEEPEDIGPDGQDIEPVDTIDPKPATNLSALTAGLVCKEGVMDRDSSSIYLLLSSDFLSFLPVLLSSTVVALESLMSREESSGVRRWSPNTRGAADKRGFLIPIPKSGRETTLDNDTTKPT